ncbi:aminoglycoside phosphotransferase family protein [Flaviflexus huanghaiensis]|uniref:aminoglycoside phosphotransferase family protein n=1 Tax=Flaviflexus huanghaiensis TaxID=1111473 RepID=UPI0015F931F5|nr:aminoglycoside phosphotransferase family protein [Flaviflexus huanghaiensis]
MNETILPDLADAMEDRLADPFLTNAFPRHGTTGAEWIQALPRLLDKALRRWDLSLDETSPAPVRAGSTSLVLDVLAATRRPAILQLAWPSVDSAFEHLALREWDGHGAVRLEAAEPRDYALLLERLDDSRPLAAENILDACETVGTLLRTLDRPAHVRFQSLVERSQRWQTALDTHHPRVPRRLIAQARSHMADLVEDIEAGVVDGGRLIHANLHDRNVLAPFDPGRGEWLAISPRPLAGELAFAVKPMMSQRFSQSTRAHNPRAHVRMRASIIADVAGLDEDRVRAWTFVRLVLDALDAAHAATGHRLTQSITLAKMFDQ